MIPMVAMPRQDKHVNLNLLNMRDCIISTVGTDADRTSASTAQTSGYGFGNNFTVGSTTLNGVMTLLNDHDSYMQNGVVVTPTNMYLTTYGGNVPQARFMFPVQARDGITLSKVFLQNAPAFRNGSGVTGTLSVRLCKMTSAGTITTIATGSAVIADVASTQDIFILNTGTPTSFTSSDFIVLEFEIALTSGTHNTANYTSVNFGGGVRASLFYIS